jgi:hypothetical protein
MFDNLIGHMVYEIRLYNKTTCFFKRWKHSLQAFLDEASLRDVAFCVFSVFHVTILTSSQLGPPLASGFFYVSSIDHAILIRFCFEMKEE